MATTQSFPPEVKRHQPATVRRGRPPLDAVGPEKWDTATFGLGWFWGPDARFGSIKGVVRTRVGYSGGTKENPTYHDLGDHTETVQIDYDPTQISYEELLDVFWKSHNPKYQSWSRQYMIAVFYHDEEQKRRAEETKRRIEEALGTVVQTKILPASTFYRAEDYHQKYGLRKHRQFVQEYGRIYPHEDDFVDSTAVARVNGYVSGYGTPEELEVEIGDLGLSEEAKEALSMLVSGRKGLDR